MKPKVMALVPARGGSKGVPMKNIRRLGGYPLIAFSILAGNLARHVDRVVVSTDSQEIAEIARWFGAEVPFLRPRELARDKSPDRDFVMHALEWFKDKEGFVADYLVHLRPTTPFREVNLIDTAIEEILARPEATSLRSGHEAPETPFKWFSRNQDGYFEGLLPDDARPEYYNLPRQAFPPVYIPNGYVDILKSEFVLASDSLHGSRMIGFITPEVKEVDTEADFAFLEYEIAQKGHVLFERLQKQFPKLTEGE
jgi:CMP-N,N'-diacetyllegionaminic acid synthase